MPAKYTPSRGRGKAKSKASNRPKKPYKEYPLYAHPLGYWSKKVDKQILHFGRWGRVVDGKMTRLPYEASWQQALANYKARVDDAQAGRIRETVVTDQKPSDGLTIADLCNQFLTAKLRQLESGDIGKRMFEEYRSTTDRLVQQFGKHQHVDGLVAKDFESLRAKLAGQYGPHRLSNEVQKVRTVFKYGYESGIIDKPVRYGPLFVKPSASVLRKHRAKNGKKMLTAEESRALIDAAPVPLKAMILLGLNAGFGNHDCATLPLEAVDLDRAWVDYPRPKTGIERRCPLWPETIDALQAAIAERPAPKTDEAAVLVFVTTRGRPWLSRDIANPVSVAARDLMKEVGVHRKGLGFYTLRHVFRTAADGARDQVAANLIMGHSDPSMAATYREHIEDSRLQAVTDHVRTWLFGEGCEK